jgi:hypothetical protein
MTPWTGDQPVASTYTGQHNTEKCRYIYMPQVGFEPMIPVFEQLKTVCASDVWPLELALKEILHI